VGRARTAEQLEHALEGQALDLLAGDRDQDVSLLQVLALEGRAAGLHPHHLYPVVLLRQHHPEPRLSERALPGAAQRSGRRVSGAATAQAPGSGAQPGTRRGAAALAPRRVSTDAGGAAASTAGSSRCCSGRAAAPAGAAGSGATAGAGALTSTADTGGCGAADTCGGDACAWLRAAAAERGAVNHGSGTRVWVRDGVEPRGDREAREEMQPASDHGLRRLAGAAVRTRTALPRLLRGAMDDPLFRLPRRSLRGLLPRPPHSRLLFSRAAPAPHRTHLSSIPGSLRLRTARAAASESEL